jgi:hypothetical protein
MDASQRTASQRAATVIKAIPIFSRYILFFVFYVIAFVCMFQPKTELFGYGFGLVAQAMLGIGLVKDMFYQDSWYKGAKKKLNLWLTTLPIMWIIFAGYSLQLVSFIFILIILNQMRLARKNKNNHNKANIPQSISGKTRKQFDQWRAMYVTVAVLIWVLVIYSLFLDGPSMLDTFAPLNICLVLFSSGVLGISSYMVYMSQKMAHYMHAITDG